MDTSEEYIKMCKKAVEVQEYGAEHLKQLRPLYCWDDILQRVSMYLWMPTTLSHKLNMDTDEIIISIEEDNEANIWYDPQKGSIVWLPRQDQLQEMWFKWRNYGPHGAYENQAGLLQLLDNIHFFYFDQNKAQYAISMEQLWLAFVMEEKYGKIWDGEDWVKEG